MASEQNTQRVWPTAVVLVLSLCGILVATLLVENSPESRALMWDVVTIYCGITSGAIILRARRNAAPSWRGAHYLAFGMFAVAGAGAVFLANEISGTAHYAPSLYDIGFLAIAIPFLLPLRPEFQDHFEPEDRREIGTD